LIDRNRIFIWQNFSIEKSGLNRAERTIVKTAPGLFGLAFLGLLITKMSGVEFPGVISYAVLFRYLLYKLNIMINL
jgi:hypothetical protein